MAEDMKIKLNDEIFVKALERMKKSGVDLSCEYDIIIFLEKEINSYREKIMHMENRIEVLHGELNAARNTTTTLEAAKENTAAEIIKALSDNGYNTITINCYKDN